MSVTYHAKRKKRQRTHGFRKRIRTTAGKRVLSRRRRKKRRKLTA